MNIYFAVIFLIISFYLLFFASEKFIDSSVNISDHFGIPKIITGVVIVGFATSSPEIAVAVQASFQGYTGLAFGNALGSVICNETFGIGLALLFSATLFRVNKRYLYKIVLFLILGLLLTFFFIIDGTISKFEAIFLLLLLLGYFILLYNFTKKNRIIKQKKKGGELAKNIIIFWIALISVVFFGNLIVKNSVFIAQYFGLSKTIIALTIVAFGTSLPETVTAIVAFRKNHADIAIGNILGSDVINVFGIIGLSALIKPIEIPFYEIYFSYSWLFIVVLFTISTLFVSKYLSRKKGIVLLVIYIIYLSMSTYIAIF